MNNLKTLSKSFSLFDGAVTFFMLPYTAHKASLIIAQITETIGKEEWDSWDHALYVIEPYVTDIEFTDVSNIHIRGLQTYWQQRNGDMAHNRQLFHECISLELVTPLFTVFNETREALPAAPAILAHGEPDAKRDPKGGRRGRPPSKRKS